MSINEFLMAMQSVDADTLVDLAKQVTANIDLDLIDNVPVPTACWG